MRAVRKLLGAGLGAVLVTALLVLANPAPAMAADGGAEASFVSRVNGIRSSVGLAPLQVDGGLVSVARAWSDQMVANGAISHNGGLPGQVSGGWSKLGENVGVGGDVASLMTAFVNSAAHYHNIVDPAYNYIGVGVSYDANGTMYVTHDFMAKGAVSAPPADEPASEESPASAPTAGPAPKQQKAAAAPASDLAPVADAAPAETPPPPPPPPATSTRVHTVLTALRAVGN